MGKFRTFQETISAEALDSCHVKAAFEDETSATIDLSDIIGRGPWEKLADPAFFQRAHAAFGTIAWGDGIDLAPEDVWDRAQKANLGAAR